MARNSRKDPPTSLSLVPSTFLETVLGHWSTGRRLRIDLRRGRRGAWQCFDTIDLVSVEGIAPTAQARGLLSEVMSMVRDYVDERDERHDARVVVETEESEHASDPVALQPGGDDAGVSGDSMGNTDANNRLLSASLKDALRANTEMVRACSGMLQSASSSMAALSMVHGVNGEKAYELQVRQMEHQEEMRRWDSVDAAADKLISPLAEKLGDLFVQRMAAGGGAHIDPVALAREMLESLTPEQLVKLATAVDAGVAQDIAGAVKAAAAADDAAASWAAWEAAAMRIRPHAPKLQKLLTKRQMEILRLVSQGHAAWQRGQG